MRRLKLLLLSAIVVATATTFGGLSGMVSSASAGGSPKITLTIWQDWVGEAKAVGLAKLISAFEKLHPNITIKDVSQGGSNYFALLSAAAISGTGPDLAVEWTGQFDQTYESYILNLKPYLTKKEISTIEGATYAAADYNTSKGMLVIPLDHESYIGFYNKALFAKAGLTKVPMNWSQLYSDCSALRGAGIQPMVYGNTGALVIGTEFYPWYDVQYLMAGLYSPTQFHDLYSGKLPWTSPAILSQLKKWDSLVTKGCTNRDVLTNSNTLSEFVKGKAAMIVDGTWDTATLEQGLGSKLGVFVPPYYNTKVDGVVQYPGDGLSVMKYSKHISQAVEFEKFLLTEQAAKILASVGVNPDHVGFNSTNPVYMAIQKLITDDHYTVYPMIDNIVQTNVVSTGSQEFDAAFSGDISANAALKAMAESWQQLPASQK